MSKFWIFDGPVDVKRLVNDTVMCGECGVMVSRFYAQAIKSNSGSIHYCQAHRKEYDEVWMPLGWPPQPGPPEFYRRMRVDGHGVPFGYVPKDKKR